MLDGAGKFGATFDRIPTAGMIKDSPIAWMRSGLKSRDSEFGTLDAPFRVESRSGRAALKNGFKEDE